MTELEEYRAHLMGVSGHDSQGCNMVGRDFNQDDLNCLFVVTTRFHERQQAKRMRAFQLLQIASWFQCEALNEALSSLDADEVAEIHAMLDMKLKSISV